MLDRNSATPLWEQLETILKEKIDNGFWSAGDKIASENELSKEFSISRMTVRSVMTRMVQDGLLYRVPGKGTFIADSKIETKPWGYIGIREQLRKVGLEIVTEVTENKVIMPEDRIAKKLSIDKNQAIYYIERVRSIKDKNTLSLHKTYLRQLFNPLIDETKLCEEQLCDILKKDYNIISTHTKETLEMVYADEKQVDLLKIKPSRPLMYLQEERSIGNVIVEYTEVYFKGDHISISFEYDNEKGI